jgi:hypothetical protein
MTSLLRSLEVAVCEVLARGAALPGPERIAQLQIFDFLGQRFQGLGSCLGVLAAALDEGIHVPASPLYGALLLESQRSALLPGLQTVPDAPGSALELF